MFFIFLILNNKGATKIGTGLGNPNLGAGPDRTSQGEIITYA
jgi:hypothetical protein